VGAAVKFFAARQRHNSAGCLGLKWDPASVGPGRSSSGGLFVSSNVKAWTKDVIEPIKSGFNISFCTSCKNRLWQLPSGRDLRASSPIGCPRGPAANISATCYDRAAAVSSGLALLPSWRFNRGKALQKDG